MVMETLLGFGCTVVPSGTKNMQFITGVTAAVYRYNPIIIAQAFASLDVLYPGRIGLGVGTGEVMNEIPAGFDWPSADIRLARTTEVIRIISRRWSREEQQHQKERIIMKIMIMDL